VPRVLLATCAAYPDGDEDAHLLLAALRAAGLDASFAVWDDPAVDWSAGLTVLRSTWDYPLRREEFLDWMRAVPAVVNPAAVVAWNSDKLYLHELERAGIPIPPTAASPPGSAPSFPATGEFVVKPSIGAGSRGAGRFSADDAGGAAEHAAALHAAGRTVLVQPYLADVDQVGETALLYADGEFSHAIRKGAMLGAGVSYDLHDSSELFVEEDIAARAPSLAELDLGTRAIAEVGRRFGAPPVYARVDLLPTPNGPVVVELELVEPSLFLSFADGAAERFAAAIAARLP
jgi:hypothetical protein